MPPHSPLEVLTPLLIIILDRKVWRNLFAYNMKQAHMVFEITQIDHSSRTRTSIQIPVDARGYMIFGMFRIYYIHYPSNRNYLGGRP